jgi:aminomethyltransferase
MANEGEALLRTPLYGVNVEEGARMVSFGGWEMPVQYEGINIEHRAVREEVGLFDISHMGQFSVEGPRALEFLEYLLPARIAALAVGKMLYVPMCNERGGCVDDSVVYRLGETQFMLVVNASRIADDWAWVTERSQGWAEVCLANLSAEKGMVAVQGPKAEAVIGELAGTGIASLGYYWWMRSELAGIAVLLSRNGYTGEDGFEIICAATETEALWRALRERGVRPCGLGARDTLRTEMGFSLYGHELNESTTPLEAGLAWTLDLDKEVEFIGRAALRQQKEAGNHRRLRGFRMLEKSIPRPEYPVLDSAGEAIGVVSSGTHSPMLNEGIGLAFLRRGAHRIGTQIQIEMRGKRRLAHVVRLPFVTLSARRD